MCDCDPTGWAETHGNHNCKCPIENPPAEGSDKEDE